MFLTLEQYLAYFPKINISREDFIRKFVITYRGNPTLADLFSFKSVIKKPEDPRYLNREAVIDYFYDVIVVNRHTYLTEFYKSYFEVPNPYTLKWDGVNILTDAPNHTSDPDFIKTWSSYQKGRLPSVQMGEALDVILQQKLPSLSLQKNDLSRKIIRNLHYLGILHETRVTNTCKSKVSFWETFTNAYNQLRLEDRFFAPSSIGLFLRQKGKGSAVNYNNFYYLFQQYQPKASILNPYTMNWVLKNLFQGKALFTPVLSWTSYLCAFMHSDWETYVGVDVMPSVCEKTQFLFDYYQKTLKPKLTQKDQAILSKKTIDLYCQPSESLLNDRKFMTRYEASLDGCLMCPPYFDMELYPEGEQSTKLYPNYQQWLSGYWEATIKVCHHVLKKEGRFGFIINDYVSLKKESYPLIKDLNLIVLKYFKLMGVYSLANRVSPLRMNKKGRTEMLFMYVK
jgi:hypothetical protein